MKVMINRGLLTSSRIRTKGSKVAEIGLAPRDHRRHVELCLRVYRDLPFKLEQMAAAYEGSRYMIVMINGGHL